MNRKILDRPTGKTATFIGFLLLAIIFSGNTLLHWKTGYGKSTNGTPEIKVL